MEPIFAAQSNRLSSPGASRRVSGPGRAERLDALKPVQRIRRVSLDAGKAWETLRGVMTAPPEAISAEGWQGHRLSLRSDAGPVQVVTGRLVGPDGQPQPLAVGDTLTVHGYRLRAVQGLVATRIEREPPREPPAPSPPCSLTVGPLAVAHEAPDGHYLLPEDYSK
jgi:hypothetical protein